MSKETKIEWADSTVNFWSGCTKVSDGCKNCYAEVLSNRKLGNIGEWGKGAARKRHQSAFNLALQLNRTPLVCDKCGHGFGGSPAFCPNCQCVTHHRRRVFSLSLGDWLDPEVPIEWLAEMLDTIRRCDQLEWLLVTKRPELWKSRLEQIVIREDISTELFQFVRLWLFFSEAPKHVMVLTSVENQQAADERIPALINIPAASHGLSCEPLLGPVDLGNWIWDDACGCLENEPEPGGGFDCKHCRDTRVVTELDWVIIGGESGTGARVCNVDWIRDLKNQCESAGVACFIKQFGANPVYTAAGISPNGGDAILKAHWNDPKWNIPWNSAHNGAPKVHDKKGGDMAEWPEDLRVREFPACIR